MRKREVVVPVMAVEIEPLLALRMREEEEQEEAPEDSPSTLVQGRQEVHPEASMLEEEASLRRRLDLE